MLTSSIAVGLTRTSTVGPSNASIDNLQKAGSVFVKLLQTAIDERKFIRLRKQVRRYQSECVGCSVQGLLSVAGMVDALMRLLSIEFRWSLRSTMQALRVNGVCTCSFASWLLVNHYCHASFTCIILLTILLRLHGRSLHPADRRRRNTYSKSS
jgi:uncharacterized membrane protein YqjE